MYNGDNLFTQSLCSLKMNMKFDGTVKHEIVTCNMEKFTRNPFYIGLVRTRFPVIV